MSLRRQIPGPIKQWPANFPGTKFWFSPRRGITLASGKVSDWADVKLGYTGSQSTASQRPTPGTNINGNPSVDFSGAAFNVLVNSASNPVTPGDPVYVLAVLKATSTGGSVFSFKINTTGGRQWILQANDIGGTMFYFTDGVSNSVIDAVGVPTLTTAFILEWELTLGGVPNIRYNGVARTLASTLNAASPSGTTGTLIGGRGTAGTLQPWDGSIGDIYCASPIPSAAEMQAKLNYFARINGITL